MTPPAAAIGRRPWWLTLAAWSCWGVGHLPVVPGVIAYVLVPLCLEVGWRNTFGTVDGLLLGLALICSSLAHVALMVAGFDFFKQRTRRGLWLVGFALLAVIPSVLPFLRGLWLGATL